MNHGKRSINRDWEIKLAWFSAATARYLDLGLTAEQRLCVFLECLQVAMSHGDIELIATVEDFIQKVTEMTKYMKLGDVHLKKKEYDDAISYSKKCLDIAQECGDKVHEMNAFRTLGIAHLKKEEYDDAISYSKKCLDIAKEFGDKVDEMTAYLTLRTAHFNKEEYNDTILYSKKCLDIAQERGDKEAEMNAYFTLGNAHLKKEEYDDAISYSKKCLDIAQERGDKKTEMNAYLTLGIAHLKKEEYDDPISYSKECLRIVQECGDKVAEMNAYLTLGIAHLTKEEYDDAILYSKKCLDIAKEFGDKVAEMTAYLTLGNAHWKKKEYDDAISYSKKCLSIAQECDDKVTEMNAYYTLGDAHLEKEEYDAISYSEKCLDIAQERGHKVAEMNANKMLGDVHLEKKEYDDAISYSKKCLDIAQECGDKVHEMNAFRTLGDAHLNKKEYDDAISYSTKCLDIAQECGDKEIEMRTYHTLGGIYSKKREYDMSCTYFKKGLKIAEDTQNNKVVIIIKCILGFTYDLIGLKETIWTEDDDLSRIIPYLKSYFANEKLPIDCKIYCGLCSLYISRKQYQEAELCLGEVLAIVAADGDDFSSEDLVSFKYSISETYTSLCQYDKAMQYYQETLDLAVKTEDNYFQAWCHLGLAKIFYERKQFDDAEKSFKESMKYFEVVFDNLGENDRFKIAFVDKYRESYKTLLKVLIQGNKKKEALLLSERYRARALKDLLISSYGMKKEETGQQSLQYTDVQALLSSSNYTLLFYSTCFGDLYTFLIGRNELEFSVQHFEYCETCLDKLVDKAFDEMQVRQVVSCEDRSLEAIDGIEKDKNPNPEDDELTQLLSRNIEETFSEPCCTICDSGGEPSENRDESSMTILYHKLIHNVMNSINQDEVVIIPEGPLNKVPFAALWDPDTGQYLSETKRVRLAPSMRTLKLIQGCQVNHPSDADALIIGDPKVGQVMMNGKEKPIHPLPGARQEAIDIAEILGVYPLLGNEATKPKVIEKLHKGVSVVHIAAHGSLDKATIVLAPSEETTAKKIPEEEDYMLTMADVQQAQVRAQLVVLSCCHSGRGEIKAEGVVGMCRAFLASGARAVIASLWAISDQATLEFMKKFYKYLKEGKSASTSLHLTMKDMREKREYSEAKYWAPFFLMGDDVTIQL